MYDIATYAQANVEKTGDSQVRVAAHPHYRPYQFIEVIMAYEGLSRDRLHHMHACHVVPSTVTAIGLWLVLQSSFTVLD